jgi:hypothetical protein
MIISRGTVLAGALSLPVTAMTGYAGTIGLGQLSRETDDALLVALLAVVLPPLLRTLRRRGAVPA